ncbi:MAG: glutathione peroxidase [Ruminococcus sp.]|nr:glutathione peroxidase [Ruminococcus sp.]
MNIYDFSVKDANGNMVDLSEYRGKVLLIVNTATGCGFTPQYEGLQDLYEKYNEKGFEILDFPCNQFAGQAPGTEEEIVDFCQSRYGVTFRQFAKIEVNGKNEAPLYTFLKKQKGGLLGDNIKWNFTKFLVDKDGNIIERFAPTVKPEKLDEKINNLL